MGGEVTRLSWRKGQKVAPSWSGLRGFGAEPAFVLGRSIGWAGIASTVAGSGVMAC
jgi:hypothetical protein